MCLLRELYGSGVEKLRIEHQNFTTPSNKKLEISTIASNYHIEVNPRFVIPGGFDFMWHISIDGLGIKLRQRPELISPYILNMFYDTRLVFLNVLSLDLDLSHVCFDDTLFLPLQRRWYLRPCCHTRTIEDGRANKPTGQRIAGGVQRSVSTLTHAPSLLMQ